MDLQTMLVKSVSSYRRGSVEGVGGGGTFLNDTDIREIRPRIVLLSTINVHWLLIFFSSRNFVVNSNN